MTNDLEDYARQARQDATEYREMAETAHGEQKQRLLKHAVNREEHAEWYENRKEWIK